MSFWGDIGSFLSNAFGDVEHAVGIHNAPPPQPQAQPQQQPGPQLTVNNQPNNQIIQQQAAQQAQQAQQAQAFQQEQQRKKQQQNPGFLQSVGGFVKRDVLAPVKRQLLPANLGQHISNNLKQGAKQATDIGQVTARGLVRQGQFLAQPIQAGINKALNLPNQNGITPQGTVEKKLLGGPVQTYQQEYKQHKGGLAGAAAVGLSAAGDIANEAFGGKAKSAEEAEQSLARLHEVGQAAANYVPPAKEIKDAQQALKTKPTTIDKVMANTTGMTPQAAAFQRIQAQKTSARNLQAEQAAIDHLQNGGTRDEAAQIYSNIAKVSQKQAAFRLRGAAKEAETPLHPNPEGKNPLANTIEPLDTSGGNFKNVRANKRIIDYHITNEGHKALSFEGKLSANDTKNLVDYAQGVKDVKEADNPELVGQAIDSARGLFDVGHELDRPYAGKPVRYIQKFWPQYWNSEDPKILKAMNITPEKIAEFKASPEGAGSTNEEALRALWEKTHPSHDFPLDVENYSGFRNKSRIFATQAEGRAAKYQPLNENPFDDIRRYMAGARINIGNQSVIQGIAKADSGKPWKTIDLFGGKDIKVSKQAYKQLRQLGVDDRSMLGTGYDKASRMVVQTIVANPVFHGGNQEVQSLIASGKIPIEKLGGRIESGPLGMAKFNKARFELAKNPELYRAQTDKYIEAGGHFPSYGTYQKGVLYRAFDKVGAGGLTKVSPAAMREIERMDRVALFTASERSGMDITKAVQNIDHYLGDDKAMNMAAQRAGLFLHYFKTMGGALAGHVRHPIAESGATANALALVAVFAGLDYGWQHLTGNKNASVRLPGELGLADQAYKSVGQVQRGQVPSLITNRINPLIKFPVETATNKDLSKPVYGPEASSNTLRGPKGEGIGTLATKDLFGPGQNIQRTMNAQQSGAETALSSLTGLYTPHAKGYQAAPNIPILNAKGAQPGTGIDQRNAYFKAQDQAYKILGNDAKNIDTFNAYLDKNYDANGNSIRRDPKDTMHDAQTLWNNDKLLQAVKTRATADKSHDPMWDLSPDQLKTYLSYKSKGTSTSDQFAIADQNPWIYDLEAKQNAFYKSLPPGKSVASAFEQQHPFPLTDQQEALRIQVAKTTDPTAKNQLYQDHPELTELDQKMHDWNNARRVNEGFAPLPDLPKDPNPGFTKSYMNGDKNQRKSLRNSHPSDYTTMQNYLAQSSLNSALEYAASAQLEGKGSTAMQKFLKAAYSLGQYDITKNADGTYTFNPQASSSGSKKSKSGSGASGGYLRLNLDFKPNKLKVANPRKIRTNASKDYIKYAKVKQKPYFLGQRKGKLPISTF